MKNFSQYALIKDLAESIVYFDLDADQICEDILSQIQKNGIDSFDEFYRPISNIARTLGGMAGLATGALGDAGRAVGGAAISAAQKVGQAASAVGQKVGQAASAAGQYAGEKYAQGAKAQALKQVEDRLNGLQDAMLALGISQQNVNMTLKTIRKVVEQGGISPEMTRSGVAKQAGQEARRATFDRLRQRFPKQGQMPQQQMPQGQVG